MHLQYGAHPAVNLLIAPAQWTTNSRATALGGRYTYARSNELALIDAAITAVEANPSPATINTLNLQITLWLNAKRGRFTVATGAVNSKRGGAVNALRQQLADLATLHAERDVAMARIEGYLAAVDWRRRCLCAELYDEALNLGAVDAHTQTLAEESNFSSGWARVIARPSPLAFWRGKGVDEEARLAAWPNVPMRARLVLQSRAEVEGRVFAWPQWGALGIAHVRAGLFCHSSAALAAHIIHHNRAAIQAGLGQWQLRSIDIIHQRSRLAGDMSHWWIAINRPDHVVLNGGPRSLDTLPDMNLLPFLGGFVVDIWGALWLEQEGHQDVWSTSTNVIAHDATHHTPFIVINDNTDTLTVYTHHVY